MSGYHYARKITVTNEPAALPRGMHWIPRSKRPPYLVRSDAGGMNTRFDDCPSLTEARKIARDRAKSCGWAEVFRWCENAQQMRAIIISVYDREIQL